MAPRRRGEADPKQRTLTGFLHPSTVLKTMIVDGDFVMSSPGKLPNAPATYMCLLDYGANNADSSLTSIDVDCFSPSVSAELCKTMNPKQVSETPHNSSAPLRERHKAQLATPVRSDGDNKRSAFGSASIATEHGPNGKWTKSLRKMRSPKMSDHLSRPTHAGAGEHASSVDEDGAKFCNPPTTGQVPISNVDGDTTFQSPFTVSSCSTPDSKYQSGSSPVLSANMVVPYSLEELGVNGGAPQSNCSRKRRRSSVTVHIISSDTIVPSETGSREITPKLEQAAIASVIARHIDMRPPSSSSLSVLSVASRTPSLSPSRKERQGFASVGRDFPIVISSSQDEDNLEDEAVLVAEDIIWEKAATLPTKPNEAMPKDGGMNSQKAAASLDKSDTDTNDSDTSIPDIGILLGKRVTRSQRKSPYSNDLYRHQESAFAITPTPQYKFSLSSLATQNKRDSNAQAEVAKAKAALQVPEVEVLAAQIKREDGSDTTISTAIDDNLLASMVHDDEGENRVGRLLQAVSRTEMLKTENVWFFFDAPGTEVDTKFCEFPDLDSQPSGWLSDFKGTCLP